ncbi:MAG: LLM class flavin-dependent oxidoreductase, partial [Bauldia sp.]|nr:LLM class flavin-dependent oxidoreductase [Bauldia sp.]
VIAEQFGTLAALHPGRIDLGLGRAPGTDQLTAMALRRNLQAGGDSFPQDVVELIRYFGPIQPGQRVRAIPGAGLGVPIWILGSSLYGAQLAAMLGLPYAFASHFAPAELETASALYRERFEPSDFLDRPQLMLALNVIAADSDDEATLLFSSLQQAFVNLRTGRAGQLPPPRPGYFEQLDEPARAMLRQALACSVVGAPETVAAGLADFVDRYRPDEVIVTAQVFDHAARLRSFEIAMEAAKSLG